MKFGTINVTLLSEDALLAQPDWRRRAAQAHVDAGCTRGRLPKAFDSIIRAHIQFLRAQPDVRANNANGPHARVTEWESVDVRFELQARIVAGLSAEDIAKDLGVAVEDVLLYQQLFFDVTADDGALRPGMRHNIESAIAEASERGALLLSSALRGGAGLLERIEGSRYPSDMPSEELLQKIVLDELLQRTLNGRMTNTELTRVMGNHVALQRMKFETGQMRSPDRDSLDVALSILKMAAPKVVEQEFRTETQQAEADDALRSRLTVKRNIDAVHVTRTGDGDTAITELLKKSFAGSASAHH